MTTDLTATRKDEVRQLALDAINGMQSRFFRATVQLETEEEAKYAAGLWPGHSERNGTKAAYHAHILTR